MKKKHEFILSKCRDKNVLDLGCIEHELFRDNMKRGTWLHHKIKQLAKSVIGVDLLEEYLPELRQSGYDIIYGNVEKLHEVKELEGKTFDVIVAGDLIEHLFNAGLFLDSLKLFCGENTEIIITTPNVMAIHFFFPNLRKGIEPNRDDHTCWYSMRTLCQLFEMKGFQIAEKLYGNDQVINGIRPFFRVMFKKIFPHMGHKLMIVAKI